ncbi:NINE protein [Actinomyces ruminis]|uniref:TM2 domain-containing protein n=1 Tax=Actinomyces ruminis TaxID=1937003 RepID=A0ABX4MG69_9ACTO|nr:TM2 domain-containing protein [Actinomyces ruminis]
MAAALLAFFLGRIGVHDFYRGQTRQGVIHLCLVGSAFALIVAGGMVIRANTNDYGYMGEGPAAIAVTLMSLGMVPAVGNQIWAFVEFIMILASNDGSLQ